MLYNSRLTKTILAVCICFSVTKLKAQLSDYNAAMANPALVASYKWWKLVNPTNALYTDTGIVNYSRRTNIKLLGWLNSNVNFSVVMSNDSLVHLQALKNANTILLRQDINDVGLYNISTLTSLTNINVGISNLSATTVTDRGMAQLSKLVNLQVLDNLICPNVTDGGLNSLRTLTKLKEVNLMGWTGITNNGLNIVKAWPNLEKLKLSHMNITDDAINVISAATSLKSLDLEFDNITNTGLGYLSNFHSLTEIVLGHTQIDDKGAKLLSLALKSNPSLTRVTLYGTNMSAAMITRLRTDFPNVSFYIN